jgi:hypothetical protein
MAVRRTVWLVEASLEDCWLSTFEREQLERCLLALSGSERQEVRAELMTRVKQGDEQLQPFIDLFFVLP